MKKVKVDDTLKEAFEGLLANARAGFTSAANIEVGKVVEINPVDIEAANDNDRKIELLELDGAAFDITLNGLANMRILPDGTAAKLNKVTNSRELTGKVINLKQYARSLDDGGSVLDKKFKVIKKVPTINNYAKADAPDLERMRHASFCYDGYAEYLEAISLIPFEDADRGRKISEHIPTLLKSKLNGQQTEDTRMMVNVYQPVD